MGRWNEDSQTFTVMLNDHTGLLAIESDRRGHVWVGGYDQGLYLVNTRTGQTEHIQTVDGNEANDRIYALHCDEDGDMWVGGLNVRLTRIIPTGEQVHYEVPMVFGLCPVDRDRVAAGTAWGFYVVNKRTGQVDAFQQDPEQMKWRGSNMYNSVASTDGRYLWLASEGGGLVCCDLKTKELQGYTTDDGLPSNYLTAVVLGRDGRLWVSTVSNGLFSFDPKSRTVVSRVHQFNGIPMSGFSANSVRLLSDGRIAFGGDAGAVLFQPSDLVASRHPLSIYFTRLLVGEENVNMVDHPDILSSPLNQATRVVLPYDRRSMSIDVCLDDIYNQTNNRLRYRLVGYIDEWQNVNASGRISFVLLPPGAYHLELAVTPPGSEDVMVRRLTIHVQQPFYLRWYMLCVYLLVLLLLAWLFYTRYRKAPESRVE